MDQKAADSILRKLYYDPASPGAFGGVNVLYKAARSAGHKVSLANVRNFIQNQTTYQKNARILKKHVASDRYIV